MNALEIAVGANRSVLEQGLDLLARIPESVFTLSRTGRSPVSSQYRHVLEHYHCFFDGLASGRIDYDARRRDQSLAASRDRAADATRTLIETFEADRWALESSPLDVQMRTATEADAAEWHRSSVGRELQFLVSHTVHHYALIKLMVEAEGIAMDREFGIAPSTLAHARVLR
jgi:hypothetical protein